MTGAPASLAAKVARGARCYVTRGAGPPSPHARGTVGQSPGQFKEIITAALGKANARATWSMAVQLIAAAYHEQVQLDFECFRDYYEDKYGKQAEA